MSAPTLLIVDDEPHITCMLAYKIRQLGCAVLTASDGLEGLELAREHRPAVIITDLQMPVMSGFEMTIALREDPRTAEIPVVMLTGRGHKVAPSELGRTNIQHIVAKPFSSNELFVKLRELLDAAGIALSDLPEDPAEGALSL